MTQQRRPRTRREVLAGVAAGSAVLAGCLGGDGDGDDGEPSGSGDDSDAGDDSPADGSDVPVRGDPEATVALAVYEDYACPHCRDYVLNGSPELVEAYVEPGDIRYEHRDLPIPVADPESWEAASAAREMLARAGHDAFWDYAKRLYEEQSRLGTDTPELYAELATAIDDSVDGAAVRAAGVDRAHDDAVQADRERAVDLGAEGTPTFVLDGEIVASGYTDAVLAEVRAAIDEALGYDDNAGSGGY
ncbi:MAG: thioredoxin domain-containing protein [Halovenus sp.]